MPRRLPAVVLLVLLSLAAGCSPGGGKLMTRDEFRAAVMGKTKDEVIKVLGRPESTTNGAGVERWFYNGRTTDSASGRWTARRC